MTFTVRPGEVFGFVGSNGAGKTTTMRIVLGVLTADAGEVRWKGTAVDADLRRRIGYMPEERGLYPKMKVGEQLRYLARLHGLTESAAAASVQRWTDRLGIAERVGDEVQKLSLGNQQRVQLCAALVHDPEVLVLDEPFSGLDPTAVEVMSGVLRDKADAGVPVIFSSHQLELVERLCDRIGIIATGRMVAVGSVEELRERAGAAAVLEVYGPGAGLGRRPHRGGRARRGRQRAHAAAPRPRRRRPGRAACGARRRARPRVPAMAPAAHRAVPRRRPGRPGTAGGTGVTTPLVDEPGRCCWWRAASSSPRCARAASSSAS